MSGLLSDFVDSVKYSGFDQQLYGGIFGVTSVLLAAYTASKGYSSAAIVPAVLTVGSGSISYVFFKAAAATARREDALQYLSDHADAPSDVTLLSRHIN